MICTSRKPAALHVHGDDFAVWIPQYSAIGAAVAHPPQSTPDSTGNQNLTVDFFKSPYQRITLASNITLTLKNLQHGQTARLQLVQDSTGSRTVTWAAETGAGIVWAGGSAPTLTTTANHADLIVFTKDDRPSPKAYIGHLEAGNASTGGTTPKLLTASVATVTDPDCVGNSWVNQIGWTTQDSDDVNYQIDIDYCATNGCTPGTSLVTGRTTSSSSYNDDTTLTGLKDGLSNPVTSYRTYKVKLVRKSDSTVMDSKTMGQLSVTTGDCI